MPTTRLVDNVELAAAIAGVPTGGTATAASTTALAVGQETFSRMLAVGSPAAATGVVRLSYFTARADLLVGNIRYCCATIAAGATPTLIRYGLYSEAVGGDLTLIGSTLNSTSTFAATTTGYTRPLTTAAQITAGNRYATALIVVTAATAPTIAGIVTTLPTADQSLDPSLVRILSAQTDLPASIPVASLGNSANLFYAVVLP